MLSNYITEDWKAALAEELSKEYFISLSKKVDDEYDKKIIFPEKEQIFAALKKTPFNKVKTVILGQDPYINKDQANGLSFSVQKDIKLPPSLRNVFKEYCTDLGYAFPAHGDLSKWAKEGVLLLNSSLTVESGVSNSHQKLGWQTFTNQIIKVLDTKKTNLVFILWGNNAKKKKSILSLGNHLIIESAHPSPLSARKGFFGSRPFSRTNKYLISKNIDPIDWELK